MLEYADDPKQKKLTTYKQNGGYQALQKALNEMKPADVTEEVLASGLRGRGGAGFPAGRKWKFVPETDKPKYLCRQRRRERAGHLQGPPDHGARSLTS